MSWRSRRSRCNSSATTEAVQETLPEYFSSFFHIWQATLWYVWYGTHKHTHCWKYWLVPVCVWLLAAAVMVCFHQCLGLWSVSGRLGVFVAVLSCYRWQLRCLRACGGPDDWMRPLSSPGLWERMRRAGEKWSHPSQPILQASEARLIKQNDRY